MHLSLLQPIIDRPGPWASVYAEIPHSTEDAAKQRELSADAAARQLAEQGADRATCDAVRATLANARADGEPADLSGRAVFATGGEVVLDAPLSGRPARSFASWSPLPRITPWAEAAADDVRCLVVYVDREEPTSRCTATRAPWTPVMSRAWTGRSTAPRRPTGPNGTSRPRSRTPGSRTPARSPRPPSGSSRAAAPRSCSWPATRANAARCTTSFPEPLRTVTYESDHGGRAGRRRQHQARPRHHPRPRGLRARPRHGRAEPLPGGRRRRRHRPRVRRVRRTGPHRGGARTPHRHPDPHTGQRRRRPRGLGGRRPRPARGPGHRTPVPG
ncbi:hypothetical protein SRIMM317S_04271 [Streptomyces rimosus subsp. rimosus]